MCKESYMHKAYSKYDLTYNKCNDKFRSTLCRELFQTNIYSARSTIMATSLLKHTYVQKYGYILNINVLFGAMPLQGHQSEW